MKKFLHKTVSVATCCFISCSVMGSPSQTIISKMTAPLKLSGLSVGDAAPALRIAKLYQSPKGQPMTPQDLKGNVVVLEFWATWCAPCIAQMPHLNDLAQKFKKQPIRFIYVSEEKVRAVEHFLKQSILKTCIAVTPEGGIFKDYKVAGMPCTVIIGKDGRVACIDRPEKLNEALITGFLSNASTDPASAQLQVGGGQQAQVPPHVTITPSTSQDAVGGGSYMMGFMDLNGYTALGMVAFALTHDSTARLILKTPLPDGRFDMSAKVARRDAAKLPAAIEEGLRKAFNVDFVREKHKLPVLVLTLPNGPKGSLEISPGGSFHISSSSGVFAGRSVPVATLIEHVEAAIGQIIVNDTKIHDNVNFVLTTTEGDVQSKLTALRSLGFKIERTTRMVDVVVVKKSSN